MEQNGALTAEEVAKQLKIAKNTVYELVKRGELPSYKVGRKLRIDTKDLEAYINRSKKEYETDEKESLPPAKKQKISTGSNYIQENIPLSFIISGQDILLDILANSIQNHPEGVQVYRSNVGSFAGLSDLYYDRCQVAAVHLWDSDLDTYNVPYVRRMVPGMPCVIIRLAKRVQGFYVKEGNPKQIKSWLCLARDEVTFINREKGSGTRILLDEMLRKCKTLPKEINGYYNEKTSHLGVANAIAGGLADVGIGCEDVGLRIKGIEFVPIHTECYDIVIKKENLEDPTYKLVYDIICSEEFKESINHIGGYDFSETGYIVAET